MNSFYILICLFVVAILFVIISAKKSSQSNAWVSPEDFQNEKRKLNTFCSEEELRAFMTFLNSYKGGFVRRRSGQIIHQDYLGNEKGDLKGIFLNIVVPNPNLSTSLKEDFRHLCISCGVNGLDKRPAYETRDSKLTNKNKDANDFARKEVGNKGEQIVRNTLEQLKQEGFTIINGPVLKTNNITKEFDHIVIGKTGVFCLETKAFGMTNGNSIKSFLNIDPGDKWIIRKNEKKQEVASPTEQIMAEKKVLQEVVSQYPFTVYPILVLSNREMRINQNISLPYTILKVDEIKTYILSQSEDLTESDILDAIQAIDNYRINR